MAQSTTNVDISPPLYDQEEKREFRKKVIEHAVRSLTTERSTSACVQRNYPRDLWDQSPAAVTKNWSRERLQRMNEDLKEWEDDYDRATTQNKTKASDLRVCCLGGDDPTNDLEVFRSKGVLYRNIWVLEKDPKIFPLAQQNIIDSGPYPGVKLERRNILTFFEDKKTKDFDIIYFDTCGSLPSAKQETLKVIATIFILNKLTSPGVLITNFSFPSKERDGDGEPEELEQIKYMAKEYLKHKVFNNETLLDRMTAEQIYSDFVTHQVIDMASLLIPACRMVLSSEWSDIFKISPRKFFEQVQKNLLLLGDSTSEVAGSDQDAGEHEGDLMDCEAVDLMNQFYMTKICNAMETGKTQVKNTLCEAWLDEVFPRLTKYTRKQKNVCSLLVTSLLFSSFDFFSRFASDKCAKFLNFAKSPEDKMLMAGLLYGMSAEPSYPVLDKLLRLEYVAKKRQMFCDVFIFDTCEYLFGLSPTVHVEGQFCDDNDNNFIIAKMVLQGMKKRLQYICQKDLFRKDIHCQFSFGETDAVDEERSLPKREIVKKNSVVP